MLIMDRFELRLPMLNEFPDFLEKAGDPRKLATEIFQSSVYENGVLVGDKVPLPYAIPIYNAILKELNFTEKNE